MGIISVGASLGVKDDVSALPIIMTATPSPLPVGRRRATNRTPATANTPSTTSNAWTPYTATSSSHFHSNHSYNHTTAVASNSSSSNSSHTLATDPASRKKPLRRRVAAAVTSTLSDSATAAAPSAPVSSIASADAHNKSHESNTRTNSTATQQQQQQLNANVHRKCDDRSPRSHSNTNEDITTSTALRCDVSTDATQQVEHGAAVVTAELLVQTNDGALFKDNSSVESNGDAAATATTSRKRKPLDADDALSAIDESQLKRRCRRRNSDALALDAFRIQLQRSAALAQRVKRDAARAKQQTADAAAHLQATLQLVDATHHKRRVADVVLDTQCALLTSTSRPVTSSSSTLRKLERASAVHDACWQSTDAAGGAREREKTFRHVVAPNLRIRTTRKSHATALMSRKTTEGEDADGASIAQLFVKIEAFKRTTMATQRPREVKDTERTNAQAVGDDDIDDNDDDDVDVDDETTATPPMDCIDPLDAVDNEDAAADATNVSDAVSSSVQATAAASETNSSSSCSDAPFRSTWTTTNNNHNDNDETRVSVPHPVDRDLNLIQDYARERDCRLLQHLVGERQYFYLAPVVDPLPPKKRWRLTPHDVTLLRAFIDQHATFGVTVAASIDALKTTDALLNSKHAAWSTLQRQLALLHPLTLAAHLLSAHCASVRALYTYKEPKEPVFTHNLLTPTTLTSDWLKLLLRPIRSSAIESSLLDTLPIALVRETVEHCPEVLNHVLSWKEKRDMPQAIADAVHDDTSTQLYLRGVQNRLATHAQALQAHLTALRASVASSLTDNEHARDAVIAQSNALKTNVASLLQATIDLHVHKWARVFIATTPSCAWIDPDDRALNGCGGGEGRDSDDRNYDKFTCLQDALAIWHNVFVWYSATDDARTNNAVVDPATTTTTTIERDATTAPPASTLRTDASVDVAIASPNDDASVARELAFLRRLTPPALLHAFEHEFSFADIATNMQTPLAIAAARDALIASLDAMKTSMDAMGRSAPWRTHVTNANALKRERAMQLAIQKQLLASEWASFYHRHHKCLPKKRMVDVVAFSPEAPASTTAAAKDEEEEERLDNVSDTKDAASDKEPAPPAIDWTGVIDARDSDAVVAMKRLRMELHVVCASLVERNSSRNKNKEENDHATLVDACSALTRTCVAALNKFIGESAAADDTTTATTNATTTRRRVATSAASTVRVAPPRTRAKRERERTATAAAAAAASTSTRRTTRRSNAPSRTSLNANCTSCKDATQRCATCSRCCRHCRCNHCSCSKCSALAFAAVHKTLTMLVGCVEATEGCKWVHAAATDQTDAIATGDRSTRRLCGLLRACSQCSYCTAHCVCGLTRSSSNSDRTSHSTSSAAAPVDGFGLRGRHPAATTRKERRFKATKPLVTQRRATSTTTLPSTANSTNNAATNTRSRRASAPPGATAAASKATDAPAATESTATADATDATAEHRVDDTSSSNTAKQPPAANASAAAAASGTGKDEQEHLFRAARVRMKLQRHTFATKLQSLYGAISPHTVLDGELLWQPERIRMMWDRKDFFGVLGVPRDATTQQIKRQYRKLALKLHPDKTLDVAMHQAHAAASSSLSGSSVVDAAGTATTTTTTTGDYYSSTPDERVEAFVAVTHSYKLLSGDPKTINSNVWRPGL